MSELSYASWSPSSLGATPLVVRVSGADRYAAYVKCCPEPKTNVRENIWPANLFVAAEGRWAWRGRAQGV